MDRLGDCLVLASVAIYVLAAVAYFCGARPWNAAYWLGCAFINFCLLLISRGRK